MPRGLTMEALPGAIPAGFVLLEDGLTCAAGGMNDEPKNEWPGLDEALLAWMGGGAWRVMGWRLRPLTLLHRELLRVIGHGLVTGGPVGIVELDLAARLCASDPFAAGRWLARRPGWWRRRWAAVRGVWLLLRWGAFLGREQAMMSEYLRGSLSAPEMMHKTAKAGDTQGPAPDAPPVLALAAALSAAGFPYQEVLRQWPCGLVEWVFQTVRCGETGSKFVTESDRQIREDIKRMQSMTAVPADPEAARRRVAAMRQRMRRGGESLRCAPAWAAGDNGGPAWR